MDNENQEEINLPHEEKQNYPLRPPKLLQSIVYNKIVDNMLFSCLQQLSRVENRRLLYKVRAYFQRCPTIIRSILLKRGLSENTVCRQNVTNRAPLVLIKILLSKDMHNLECVDTSFLLTSILEELLRLLVDEGTNFKVLHLPSRTTSERNNPLQLRSQYLTTTLIVDNRYVTHLGLSTICNNDVVCVIGKMCCCLASLDISFSEVTDDGLENLVQCFECDCINNILESTVNSVKNIFTRSKHTCPKVATKICSSLRKINLSGTDVTVKGLALLLEHMKCLANVGKEMDKLFDNLHEQYQNNDGMFPEWCLQYVVVHNLTENRLLVLRNTCNCISELNISFPVRSDNHLKLMFSAYIQEIGRNLTRLEVILPMSNTEENFLSLVLKHCQNLEYFQITCNEILWGEDKTPVPALHLKDARLNGKLSAKDAKLFLESAVHLEEVSFENIISNSNVLVLICEISISALLNKFIVRNGNVLNNPQDVLGFWMINQQIRSIGHVNFGLDELGLVENADLELIRNN